MGVREGVAGVLSTRSSERMRKTLRRFKGAQMRTVQFFKP